jgi:hypothetical protein
VTRHVDILGLLFVLMGAFELVVAALVGLGMIGGGAVLGLASGDPDAVVAGGFMGLMGLVTSVISGILAIPGVLVGAGIRRRRPWARIGGLVLGAFQLTSIPLGTMLGVYAFVTLLDKDVAAEFGVVA